MEQKAGVLYTMLSVWIRLGIRVYFSKVSLRGFENIPQKGTLMLVANHQNALLDALVVAVHIKRPIYFITRADVFNRPLIARFLNAINMLPIFRQRDNVDTITLNKPIFEKTAKILHQQGAILIFPEGNQARVRNIRPLQKGFARMGFGAAELSNFENSIQIVPIGINYTNHTESRGSIFLQAGNPVLFKDYYPLFIENQQKALKEIASAISPLIQSLIIHIPNSDDYPVINKLSSFYLKVRSENLNLKNDDFLLHQLEQQIADSLGNERIINPENFKSITGLFDDFNRINKNYKLSPETLAKLPIPFLSYALQWLMIFLIMPFALFGWVNHLPAISLTKYIVKSNVKDHNFLASVKFLSAMILFSLFYILQTVLVSLVFGNWMIAVLYFFFLPISGKAALFCQDKLKFLLMQRKYRFLYKQTNSELLFLFRKLIEKLNQVLTLQS